MPTLNMPTLNILVCLLYFQVKMWLHESINYSADNSNYHKVLSFSSRRPPCSSVQEKGFPCMSQFVSEYSKDVYLKVKV